MFANYFSLVDLKINNQKSHSNFLTKKSPKKLTLDQLSGLQGRDLAMLDLLFQNEDCVASGGDGQSIQEQGFGVLLGILAAPFNLLDFLLDFLQFGDSRLADNLDQLKSGVISRVFGDNVSSLLCDFTLIGFGFLLVKG